MKASPYGAAFSRELEYWERALSAITDGIDVLLRVQVRWSYLESILLSGASAEHQPCCSLPRPTPHTHTHHRCPPQARTFAR